MTKTVVVLGMHRSGTSLVANILRLLGVYMGSEFLESDGGNPTGYWEDTEWLGINKKILGEAGGDWKKPPTPTEIRETGKLAGRLIDSAIASRRGYPLWGFKDPRTCLTAGVLHRHIPNPHYIIVRRPVGDVVRSLRKLHGNEQKWGELYRYYNRSVEGFLKSIPSTDYMHVQFDDLVNMNSYQDSIYWIAGRLGKDFMDINITKMTKIIRFR